MTTKNFAPPQDDKTKRNGRALRAPQNDNKGENALLRMTTEEHVALLRMNLLIVIPSGVKRSVGIDRCPFCIFDLPESIDVSSTAKNRERGTSVR